MRTSLTSLLAVICAAATLGAASSSAATSTWQAEFTQDVVSFRKVARRQTRLLKEYPLFEVQFNAFSSYAGELKAESRQLEALAPPRRCSEVQETTVGLLRRASRVSGGLGEAKNLTPSEFRQGGRELKRLPSRLSEGLREAREC